MHLNNLKALNAAIDAAVHLLCIIRTNAVVGPDAAMQGYTDCYHVPLADIDAIRPLIGRLTAVQNQIVPDAGKLDELAERVEVFTNDTNELLDIFRAALIGGTR
jgi:hypothetical protein